MSSLFIFSVYICRTILVTTSLYHYSKELTAINTKREDFLWISVHALLGGVKFVKVNLDYCCASRQLD
jgi:hypothetical protein